MVAPTSLETPKCELLLNINYQQGNDVGKNMYIILRRDLCMAAIQINTKRPNLLDIYFSQKEREQKFHFHYPKMMF